MNTLQTQISDYLHFCQIQRRLDPKTLKAYRIDLRQFASQVTKSDTQTVSPANDKQIRRSFRHRTAHHPAHVPAYLCHFSVGGRCGYKVYPGDAGAQFDQYHGNLYACRNSKAAGYPGNQASEEPF